MRNIDGAFVNVFYMPQVSNGRWLPGWLHRDSFAVKDWFFDTNNNQGGSTRKIIKGGGDNRRHAPNYIVSVQRHPPVKDRHEWEEFFEPSVDEAASNEGISNQILLVLFDLIANGPPRTLDEEAVDKHTSSIGLFRDFLRVPHERYVRLRCHLIKGSTCLPARNLKKNWNRRISTRERWGSI